MLKENNKTINNLNYLNDISFKNENDNSDQIITPHSERLLFGKKRIKLDDKDDINEVDIAAEADISLTVSEVNNRSVKDSV